MQVNEVPCYSEYLTQATTSDLENPPWHGGFGGAGDPRERETEALSAALPLGVYLGISLCRVGRPAGSLRPLPT